MPSSTHASPTPVPAQISPVLHRQLTRRYLLALALVSVVILTSHAVAVSYSRAGVADGAIINESGRQRSLSQRIALLTGGLAAATARADTEALAQYETNLAQAIAQMRANHARLSAAPLDGGGERARLSDPDTLYFGDSALDERVRTFLDEATRMLAAHRAGTLDPIATRPAIRAMVTEALGPLLEDLDAVVARYERAFTVDRVRWTRLSLMLLGIALLVIACEALFVFRPMVATVVKTVNELDVANARLRRFIHLLSHDLRAPVASAKGLIALVDEAIDEGDLADARTLASTALTTLARADALIDSLTELVRASEVRESAEDVDLAALVRCAREALAGLDGAEDVAIGVTDRVMRPVRLQAMPVRSILHNLLSNAVKYRDPARGRCWVEVQLTLPRAGWVRMTVTDNGLGVPETAADELFGAFKRFHPRAAPGSGLGLHLVRTQARTLGGFVTHAPGRSGIGASFTVEVPETAPEHPA